MVEFVKFKKKDNEDSSKDNSSNSSQKGSNNDSKKPKITTKRVIWTIVLTIVLMFLISSCTVAISPKIAIVPIKGEISTQGSMSLFSSSASSRDIANQIYTLADDETVKAIVLDINSPGGSPVASDEISKAIEYAKEKKEVISVISDLGASGAYWIAASTDRIYTAPLSIVGSIGVTSAGLSFEGLIEEYNITYRRQIAGEFKDMGSPYREQTQEEIEKTQQLLDSVHEEFINHVAMNRNMSYDEAKALSTGEIFLGKDAIELGLIDGNKYMQEVISELKNEIGNSTLVMQYDPIYSTPTLIGVRNEFAGFLQTNQELPVNLK